VRASIALVERVLAAGDRAELTIPTGAQWIALQDVPVDLRQLRESLKLIKRNRTRRVPIARLPDDARLQSFISRQWSRFDVYIWNVGGNRVERRSKHVRQFCDLEIEVVLDVWCTVVQFNELINSVNRPQQRNQRRLCPNDYVSRFLF